MIAKGELVKALDRRRKEMEAMQRAQTASTAKAVRSVRQRLLADLNAMQGPVTTASRTAAMNNARRLIRQYGEGLRLASEKDLPGLVHKSAMRAKNISSLVMAQGRTTRAAAATFEAFERSMKAGQAFTLGGEKMAAFAEKFTADWADQFTGVMRELQGTFTRASVSGLDWRQIAKQMTGADGQLLVRGEAADAVEMYAEVFARTKVTEIDNLASRALGQELGLELYVNIGIPDDGQEQECDGASNAGAMTLEEWAESEWGEPPRHWGCRCELVPVPFDPGLEVENPKFVEAAAD